jgi:hypothetical protein
VSLVTAFQQKDIAKFKMIISSEKQILSSDPYMISYVNEISRILSDEIIGLSVNTYITADLRQLADRHNMEYAEIQDSLSFLITEGKQNGKISQAFRNCSNHFSFARRGVLLEGVFTGIRKIRKYKDENSTPAEDESCLVPTWAFAT